MCWGRVLSGEKAGRCLSAFRAIPLQQVGFTPHYLHKHTVVSTEFTWQKHQGERRSWQQCASTTKLLKHFQYLHLTLHATQHWLNEREYFLCGKPELLAERANNSPLSDSWKKAGKFCRSVTVACFHILVHFNNSNLTINWCSHPQLINVSLQNSEFLLSYSFHFYYSSFHVFFLYAVSESLLYLFLPNMLY